MTYLVQMIKEYEAYVEVEADSAQEACDMIADGDFSQTVDDSYDADMSEESITSVRVFERIDEDEWNDEPAAEWDWR